MTATIDGTSFELIQCIPTVTIRNIKIDMAGSDTNAITHTGYDGMSLEVTGYSLTLATHDAVLAAFLASGGHTLVHRTGWQYTVYPTTNTVTVPPGFPDTYFPFSIRLMTADPYQYSTATTERPKTITSNGLSWSSDNSAEDIDTSGTVSAKPDIEIVAAGSNSATLLKQTNQFT